MKNYSIAAVLFSALLGGCAIMPGKNSLEELIAQHVAAMGGQAAMEAISTVEYSIQIIEPSFTVDGLYLADRQGRMRIDRAASLAASASSSICSSVVCHEHMNRAPPSPMKS